MEAGSGVWKAWPGVGAKPGSVWLPPSNTPMEPGTKVVAFVRMINSTAVSEEPHPE